MDGFLRNTLGLLNDTIRQQTIDSLKKVFKTQSANPERSTNDATRDSQPHSDVGTPYARTGNNGHVSNSLLDDESDAEILYPTPGGGVTAGGYTDDGSGTTPGGPTPGGPENQVALESEWQQISEDQIKQISALTQQVNEKNEVINQLRYDIGVLESEINTLKNERAQSNENNRNNYDNNNNNNSNYSSSSQIQSYNGDGRNINQDEIRELRQQVKDLKDMKLQLIKSTTTEINHLRYVITLYI